MRSVVLLLITVLAVALGFGAYWLVEGRHTPGVADDQGRTRPTVSDARPASLPTTNSVFGPGEEVWWDKFDEKTGQLSSRIKASHYEKLPDGRVAVTTPQAQFFLNNDQLLVIEGKLGKLTMQENVGRHPDRFNGATNQTPRAGELQEVTLRVYPTPVASGPPSMTLTMNNASFDNETFKIYTEAYVDEQGQRIAADRVKVHVVGDENGFDFDGYGLKLQYNERDKRLEFLEIAHGGKLVIKHPGNFLKDTPGMVATGFAPILAAASPKPLADASGGADRALAWPYDRVELASALFSPLDLLTLAPNLPATKPARHARNEEARVVYRAKFNTAVRAVQAGQDLARADLMQIDFEPEDSRPNLSAQTQPASKPAATRPGRKPATTPTRAPRRSGPATTRAAATMPTTQQSPITIYWTDTLTIAPLDGQPPARLAPGEAIIKLTGRPAMVASQGNKPGEGGHITCASLTHWTLDNGLLLEEGTGIPVVMADDAGKSTIQTQRMDFSQELGIAELQGKGRASFIDDSADPNDAAGKPKPPVTAQWDDKCLLHMAGHSMAAMTVESADLQGNVQIVAPGQLDMKSRQVQLAFEPPAPEADANATRPARRAGVQIREMQATGDVRCIMPIATTQPAAPGAKPAVQTFDSDKLTLEAGRGASGKLVARTVVAVGNVHFVDPERDVKSGMLSVVLAERAPTTRPSKAGKDPDLADAKIQSLVAQQNVVVRTADGKTARADQLSVTMVNDKPEATLRGNPATIAEDKDNALLSGGQIILKQATRTVVIPGAGSMRGVHRKTPQSPPKPIEITWQDSMKANIDDNLVECLGKVEARSTDPRGAVETARGERVVLTLKDKPATQPATRKADKGADEFAAMGDKEVRDLTIDQNAVLNSTLTDAKGELLRVFQAKGDRIVYNRDAGQLTIPGAGTLLFYDNDNRTPDLSTTQPAATQPAARDPLKAKGATAFSWQKQLVYSEKTRQVTLDGDVKAGRKDNVKQDPFYMEASRLVADIEPADKDAKAAAPANADDGLGSQMQIKHVHAEGMPLRVQGRQLNVEASSLEYDPDSKLLTIRGDARTAVRELDENGLERAVFDELVYNTQTAHIVAKNVRASGRK